MTYRVMGYRRWAIGTSSATGKTRAKRGNGQSILLVFAWRFSRFSLIARISRF